jgi:hypothetical protein
VRDLPLLYFTEAEFLNVIGSKVLRVFSSMLFTVTSNRFYPTPLLSKSGLKLVCNVNIVYGNLKSENFQDYGPETSTKLYVHEFGFRYVRGGGSEYTVPGRKGHLLCLPPVHTALAVKQVFILRNSAHHHPSLGAKLSGFIDHGRLPPFQSSHLPHGFSDRRFLGYQLRFGCPPDGTCVCVVQG